MTTFALLLTGVYLALGLLIVLAMRTSEAAFKRLPKWALLLVYFGAAALVGFTLAIGNPIAYIAAAVIVMGFAVYLIVRVLPHTVPDLLDGLLQPFRHQTERRRGR